MSLQVDISQASGRGRSGYGRQVRFRIPGLLLTGALWIASPRIRRTIDRLIYVGRGGIVDGRVGQGCN